MNREGKKCVLYPRVSTEMQVDGYSLEGQKNSLKRFADREEMEIVGIYEDAGKSGKSIEGRPAFKKMLSDIKNGLEIDYILVYKLSRFGRNAADILNSLEFVQSYGINLICIEEGIDSSQTSGKLLISVLSAVAEIERENIIEQTMNGRREKARQGGWNGGFAPYGYYLKDNQLLIEETEAEAIRIIFDKFANSDVGLGGVAKYLNLQGIKKIPRQNGTLETWSSHFIRLILDNPVYCGKIAYGRRTREKVKGTKNEYKQVHTDDYILEDGQHEGIVSEELWQKAHTKRMATGIKQPSKIGKDRSHLLTGILKCPICGSSMYTNKHAWTNKDGTYKEVYYYICGRNKQERGHHCDYKASLRKTDIEPLVIEAVKELVSDKYFAKEIEKRIGVQTDTTAIDKELANYESKLKEVDLNKARLEREIDNLPIDARFRERKIHDMTLRLDGLYDTIVELEERIEDAKLRRSSIEMEAITLDNIYKLMLNFGKLYDIISDEEKKSLITYLIKEIQIYPNGESEMPLKSIEFNFPIYRDGQEVRRLLWEKGNTVESVLWYDSVADLSIPMELLPDKLYNEFNTDDATMLAVFFDSATSEDVTMDAIREIRSIAGKQCFVSGMSALVTDLKDLCEQEEPIYVALAVACACAAMMLLLDGWLVPFVFLASIGMAIVYNLGSNFFLGEISYITKALSAVLQLAVTMDYSIFLWHSYNEQLTLQSDHKEAMAVAIHNTFTSVIGSSATTIAGFIALCFMSFTLGRDLGIVMAKGVLLGVLGCVTILPSLILVLDKPLQRTRHKSLIPDMGGFAKGVCKIFPVFLVIFALLVAPAYISYDKTNDEVYYDMGQCLPEDMEYVIANKKLSEEFDIASTHMLLVNADLPDSDVRSMIDEMEQVPGVKYVLGMESVVGPMIPMEVLPDSVRSMLESDQWELLLINSEYKVASDDVDAQIDSLNAILKKYDEGGMLIGEAPCMKDMIETTDHDFKVVNAISIAAIFIIITLVEGSFSLPFVLIAVIELAIFINLGLPHVLGQSLPFIAPICISTIQLGATVDYAILMTTRYKAERLNGEDKKKAVMTALRTSAPSIIVSGMGLFAATFGVALYSNIDIVGSMCMLMARGAIISVLLVLLVLPALLILCDGIVCRTTRGMTHLIGKQEVVK